MIQHILDHRNILIVQAVQILQQYNVLTARLSKEHIICGQPQQLTDLDQHIDESTGLVVLTVVLILSVISSPLGPVSRVKNMKLDQMPEYTVEQIINKNLDYPAWSRKSSENCDDAYVYGDMNGDTVGLEFTVTSQAITIRSRFQMCI